MDLDAPVLQSEEESLSPAELLQRGYRYALSLSHNGHDAEDLVHDAWLRLARRYSAAPTRALLFVAIRNAFIDAVRRRSTRRAISWDEMEADCPAPPNNSQTSNDTEALLALLNPREREALYLHHVEGYSAEEISQLTDTPRNTVLSLMHRGLKKLQALPNP